MNTPDWEQEFDQKFPESYTALTTKNYSPTTEDVNWDEIKDFIRTLLSDQRRELAGKVEAMPRLYADSHSESQDLIERKGVLALLGDENG